jgi:hypothetical protein
LVQPDKGFGNALVLFSVIDFFLIFKKWAGAPTMVVQTDSSPSAPQPPVGFDLAA